LGSFSVRVNVRDSQGNSDCGLKVKKNQYMLGTIFYSVRESTRNKCFWFPPPRSLGSIFFSARSMILMFRKTSRHGRALFKKKRSISIRFEFRFQVKSGRTKRKIKILVIRDSLLELNCAVIELET